MNPVTQSLIAQIEDPEIIRFVAQWDAIEGLVIRVYRAGLATREDDAEFDRVAGWLRRHHSRWAAQLEPYWRRINIKGIGIGILDPFAALLAVDLAADFVNNWNMLRCLPAVRQAINEWLLDMVQA